MSRSLSQREKALSWLVGGAVFGVLNLFVLSYLFENHQRLHLESSRKSAQLHAMQAQLALAPVWEEREARLRATQPRLENEATAGVQLLNQVQAAARQEGVELGPSPVFGVVEPQPAGLSVSVQIKTKSPWKALINFLAKLQGPEQFIMVESTKLQVDPGDPTQMSGEFKISKWYAPK